MHSFEYQPPKPTALTRALWRAAGADAGILQACPYGEQVKFACLGGIVASTGVLAAFASSYAFYTIFAPAQAHANSIENAGAFAMATFFGVLWGLVIFNLDRYIVASTGKGDGTEAITWQEFKNAVPRMLLGIIIAITISKPLELRIFKPEIDRGELRATKIQGAKLTRSIALAFAQSQNQ